MDKYKAKHKWRISEKELMGLSVIGGLWCVCRNANIQA
ncbi:MAG: DUF1294 domain-containing protein [Eubacterium ventriosum]